MAREIRVQDQVIKSVDRFSFYNLVDNSLEATVGQLNSASLNQTQDTQWYVGKQGVRLSGFDLNKQFEAEAVNGFIDIAMMGAQTGSDVTVHDTVDNFLATPIFDELTTANGTTAVTTFTAVGNGVGQEIDYVYLVTGSSIAGAQKFEQGATASETTFSYNPATKTITLPTGVFAEGGTVLAQYTYRGVGLQVVSDTESFSKTVKAVLDITTQDICTDELHHGQFIIPRAKVDGNFNIQVGDNPAVHNIKISALNSVCFGQPRELFSYRIIMGEAEEV